MGSPRAHQLGQLADAGRWWDAAAAACQSQPNDPDTLLIAAQAWTRLGLPTLAAATLDRLCTAFPAAERHGGVSRLREQAALLPEDRVDPALLLERAEAAASGLAARGIDLADALARWQEADDATETYRAADGNTVRRRRDGRLELVGDHRAASAALIAQHAQALAASPAPITIEGLDPPWLALGMLSATAGEGYTPGIRLVQADLVELLEGCSLADAADLARLFASDRVEWCVGPSAATLLARAIEAEPGVAHEGPVVPLATLRTRVGPPLASAVQSATHRHARDHTRCLEAVRQRDLASTNTARLAALADDKAGRPRRVALIAGRFTTVLRPMIEDLAAALEGLGCETQIITEPSDHRRLTPHAYSRAFASFDPDLIVSANHTRSDIDRVLGEAVTPASVPWVTWVQDAMPHLLRAETGVSIGPLDLAVGHISAVMHDHFGYPRERSILMPMVASEQKFNPAGVDPALAADLACEVVAFTNHSETPEQMRARLLDEVSGSPSVVAVVERVADAALALSREPLERTIARHRCEAIVDHAAPHADAASRENLFENVAMRLYDRASRHAALAWASRVCDANGWRFAVYGRGWNEHPTLAPHARGVVAHGAELCTAYHAARVSLDTSTLCSFHQRTAECALAGGLPAVLATGSACLDARTALKHRLVTHHAHEAIPVPHEPGKLAFPVYRVPDAARFAALGSLLQGVSYPYAVFLPEGAAPDPRLINADDAVGLLELGVWNPASLERLVHRAGDAAWRSAQRDRVQASVLARCTHRVLAGRILDHYAERARAQTVAA